jgi:hypothetical protein
MRAVLAPRALRLARWVVLGAFLLAAPAADAAFTNFFEPLLEEIDARLADLPPPSEATKPERRQISTLRKGAALLNRSARSITADANTFHKVTALLMPAFPGTNGFETTLSDVAAEFQAFAEEASGALSERAAGLDPGPLSLDASNRLAHTHELLAAVEEAEGALPVAESVAALFNALAEAGRAVAKADGGPPRAPKKFAGRTLLYTYDDDETRGEIRFGLTTYARTYFPDGEPAELTEGDFTYERQEHVIGLLRLTEAGFDEPENFRLIFLTGNRGLFQKADGLTGTFRLR